MWHYAWIKDEPDYNYPPNDCWESRESEVEHDG